MPLVHCPDTLRCGADSARMACARASAGTPFGVDLDLRLEPVVFVSPGCKAALFRFAICCFRDALAPFCRSVRVGARVRPSSARFLGFRHQGSPLRRDIFNHLPTTALERRSPSFRAHGSILNTLQPKARIDVQLEPTEWKPLRLRERSRVELTGSTGWCCLSRHDRLAARTP